MKTKLLLASLSLLVAGFSSAQTTDFGGPVSWTTNQLNMSSVPVKDMPSFDLNKVKAEDSINDKIKSIPWRFGYKFKTNISPQNHGSWKSLENGDKVWRIGLRSEGALTMNLILEDFHLPDGAHLYLYDSNKTNFIGAYSARNNRSDSVLGTELVHGEEIIIEYFVPSEIENLGSFTITDVVHGYRSLNPIQEQLTKTLNGSGDCNIDINCPLGDDWKDQARSVAMIVVNGGGICTGALINNSCDNGIPYFLTANHCLGGNTGTWAFRFNWSSPEGTESCATTSPSTDPGTPYDETANGASILVSGSEADHALLKIDNMTLSDAEDWKVFYAGWNHDDTDGSITQATGIHHPGGDLMKICREDDSPYHQNQWGASVWWVDEWEQGVTEGGSSGSPLFDQNGRIIGQLYGGGAACSGTVNNGAPDYYGRLGVSWDLGIGDYLDPDSCGGDNMTNDGWDPNTVSLPKQENKVLFSIYPNPSNGNFTINLDSKGRKTIFISDLTGKVVTEKVTWKNLVDIDGNSFTPGIYLVRIHTLENQDTRKLIIK